MKAGKGILDRILAVAASSFLLFKKRKGVGFVECLVMLIIVAVTIGTILQTSSATTLMQMAGRTYVESHKAAVSFFNVLESIPPDNISGDILSAVKDIAGNSINYAYISAPVVTSTGGIIEVSISIQDSKTSKRTISRIFNSYSNETVPDDRIVTP